MHEFTVEGLVDIATKGKIDERASDFVGLERIGEIEPGAGGAGIDQSGRDRRDQDAARQILRAPLRRQHPHRRDLTDLRRDSIALGDVRHLAAHLGSGAGNFLERLGDPARITTGQVHGSAGSRRRARACASEKPRLRVAPVIKAILFTD
jgi:hypothetical protein